jgi:hypothetical protein
MEHTRRIYAVVREGRDGATYIDLRTVSISASDSLDLAVDIDLKEEEEEKGRCWDTVMGVIPCDITPANKDDTLLYGAMYIN